MYFILVDRFADGDPTNNPLVDRADPQAFHGGDLAGILAHLDEIEALGARTLWLSPISRMRHEKFFGWGAFHGYWVEDVGEVDPFFGSEQELGRLSDELHRRGMRLVLDMVYNHIAMDAPLTRERPDFFHHEGGIEDWQDPHQLVHGEVHGLPDLAQENPEVRAWLLARSLRLVEIARPDGFRLDAVRHMPVDFLADLARALRSATSPDFFLLGEDFQGDALSLARTFEAGGFSAMFDFPLHYAMTDVFCRDRPLGRIAATLVQDRDYPDPGRLVTFLDNHDLPRILTTCGGDADRVADAFAFMTSSRGIPCVTYGTEVGLQGEKEPENRADMRLGEPHPAREMLQGLLRRRAAHPALRAPLTRVLALEGDYLLLARLDPAEAALVAVNRASTPRALAPPPSWASLGPPSETVAAPGAVTVAFFPRPPPPSLLEPPPPRPLEIRARVDLSEGESLRLVGAGAQLGNWRPEAGLEPAAPGIFRVERPVGDVLEFKLVRLQTDGSARWQEGENRYLFVDEGTNAVTHLAWEGP
jgi:hypothetical protein